MNLLSLALVAGVLIASFVVWREARRRGLSEETVWDVFLLALFAALFFGRAGFVFQHREVFAADWSRAILVLRYPGFSFLWAAFFGGLTAFGVGKSVGLGGLAVLDLLTLGFSWTVVLGLLPFGHVAAGALLGACFLAFLKMKTDAEPQLSALAARPGLFFSSYLIFISALVLIWQKESRGLWGITLLLAALFFWGRYRELLRMVKFPTRVLSQIRGYLEERYRDVEKRIRELKKEDPFADKSRLLDRAADDTEAHSKAGHERVTALQQQLNLILVQTKKALTKIRVGRYGICERCGKMIDTDRLAAMPAATFCLNCEKKREK